MAEGTETLQGISVLTKKISSLKRAKSGESGVKGKMICVITQLSNATKHKPPMLSDCQVKSFSSLLFQLTLTNH